MKNLYKIFVLGIAMLSSISLTQANNLMNTDPEGDTVIIKFGNNSKIVLYIQDKADLQKLTQYDINKMLEELNLSVSNLNDSIQVLTIEDDSGSKYLKDTTIIYESTVITRVEPEDLEDYEYDRAYEEERYRYMPRSKFFFNIDIGLNNYFEDGKSPDGNALHRLNTGASWYWGFDPTMRSQISKAFFIDWGAGFDMNVYRFQNNETRMQKDSTGLVFFLEPRDVSSIKSKLTTWYLQAKVIPIIAFGSNRHRGYRLWNRVDKGFRIGVGPYAGYRIWSRTKVKYNENGAKQKDKSRSDFFLNDFRYGIRGQIGIGGFDIFFMYDLNEMFQANSGAPSLNRYQFGITL
jgi:hypothetical protein